MTSLPITWDCVTSFPVTWLPPPVSYSHVGVKTSPNLTYRPPTATSRWLPVKWCHFLVTSGHVRARDVISCHVTVTSCELQPCRSSNLLKTWLIGLLQPLLCDFQSNDVTSGSLLVTWGRVTSVSVTWLPPPASYSSVGAQTYPKLDL